MDVYVKRAKQIKFFDRWETQGEWTTNQPLPLLKLRLMAEHSSKLHLSDEKELAVVSFIVIFYLIYYY